MTEAAKIAAQVPRRAREPGVVLGEDWVVPEGAIEAEMRTEREKRRSGGGNRSPLARKLITFNLIAMLVLAAGILYLNPFREGLIQVRERGLAANARLMASAFESSLASQASGVPGGFDIDLYNAAQSLELSDEVELYLFDPEGEIIALTSGTDRPMPDISGGIATGPKPTPMIDALSAMSGAVSGLFRLNARSSSTPLSARNQAAALVPVAITGLTRIETVRDPAGGMLMVAASPIRQGSAVIGVLAMTTRATEIDLLVRAKREQVLQMFVIASVLSVALSFVLASTIANPLADLAAAAELGRDKHARKLSPGRVRIPDLTARPDEIGRLSGAMRGMVAALYERIDANEQFAADVAHEIKNPLASLRSAVGTLRNAKRDDHRDKLLDIIEHDVRRLDRLVSDISNASRLDSELVKEEEEAFDLLRMLSNIVVYQGGEAKAKGVDFIADLPGQPIQFLGLEARLAQVFVNIISNAISFCDEGDAVRVWARQRENRVLVVVEDTGPGIPEAALAKVFKRFYSERPAGQFGNHSGLGLAISKQIVEAHGGVIWAENIRPTNADVTSEPLGARFVVGLPV